MPNSPQILSIDLQVCYCKRDQYNYLHFIDRHCEKRETDIVRWWLRVTQQAGSRTRNRALVPCSLNHTTFWKDVLISLLTLRNLLDCFWMKGVWKEARLTGSIIILMPSSPHILSIDLQVCYCKRKKNALALKREPEREMNGKTPYMFQSGWYFECHRQKSKCGVIKCLWVAWSNSHFSFEKGTAFRYVMHVKCRKLANYFGF